MVGGKGKYKSLPKTSFLIKIQLPSIKIIEFDVLLISYGLKKNIESDSTKLVVGIKLIIILCKYPVDVYRLKKKVQ